MQNSKMKILLLVIMLCIFNFVKETTSLDVTYILKQSHDSFEPNCIAEGDMKISAVGWVYPIPETKEDLPEIHTRFIPQIDNNFNCSFEKGNPCNVFWKINGWRPSAKTDLILDTRWEALPAIFTKDSESRTEISSDFEMGFSIRTSDDAELFLCEGWNRTSYPCYYIKLGDKELRQTYLQKYNHFQELQNHYKLAQYKYTSNALSEHEWRNFQLSFDEMNATLTLKEVGTDTVILSYKDENPLKLLYFFVRSSKPALWKIHENQFLYSEEEGMSNFGPPIKIASSNLCISLYTFMCDDCLMEFLIENNGKREMLQELNNVSNYTSSKWQHLTLRATDIFEDSAQVYVITKLKDNASERTRFWAIDEIRVCNDKEIKLSTLVLNKAIVPVALQGEDVSCQSIVHQKWRPKKHIQTLSNVLPGIETSSSSNSIKLTWVSPSYSIPSLSYLISYQGNDICLDGVNVNQKRTKSHGYVITKEHQVILEKLVPYTHYTVQFSYVLHDQVKITSLNTLPTDRPSEKELPYNVSFSMPDENAVVMHWRKPNCTDIYGPLFYSVYVINKETNYTKLLASPDTTFTFVDLEPYTTYEAVVVTSRQYDSSLKEDLISRQHYNFTTGPAVAPSVQNLEVYSADSNSVSLRYDLPVKPKGVPKYIQVDYCDTLLFKRCKSVIDEVKKCNLWPNKYCIDLNDLISSRLWALTVSLKNLNTHTFGSKVHVNGYTTDRVPGKPTNITYRMVNCNNFSDYCHLNVTWLHPYDQNGTIEYFNLILNETIVGGSQSISSHIHEVLKIDKMNYLPEYKYQIKFIDYSTHYELSVQSANHKYKSDLATILIKTDDVGDYINQSPMLTELTNVTMSFKIPEIDWRLNWTLMTVIVQDYDKTKKIGSELNQLLHTDNLCNPYGDTWVAKTMQFNKEPQMFTIGDGSVIYPENSVKPVFNKPLQPGTKYCLTFIIKNNYKQSEHQVVYYEKNIITKHTPEKMYEPHRNASLHFYVLAIVLVCVPLGFLCYRYWKKRKQQKNDNNEENVYETLPFDECDNCVFNDTYDKLIHT